jgi:hypothetical protein
VFASQPVCRHASRLGWIACFLRKYPGVSLEYVVVIRNAYPLWEKPDFELYLEALTIFQEHPFEQIWLLCDQVGRSGMLRLFPGRVLATDINGEQKRSQAKSSGKLDPGGNGDKDDEVANRL